VILCEGFGVLWKHLIIPHNTTHDNCQSLVKSILFTPFKQFSIVVLRLHSGIQVNNILLERGGLWIAKRAFDYTTTKFNMSIKINTSKERTMKVYEFMAELAKLPSGADIYFHTISPKDKGNITKYEDDPSCYQVNFDDIKLEYIAEDQVMITD
jgi:hypothetical protein